jgi:hypothetical protein
MKFTTEDIKKIRTAISAARVVGVDAMVVANNRCSGVSDKMNGCIFSDLQLESLEGIQMGLSRLGELEKRLMLFGDDIEVTAEVNQDSKVRLLNIKSKSGRIEFRCTDAKLIKAPKELNDPIIAIGVMDRAEVLQVVKGILTLSAEKVIMHVDRAGLLSFEAKDSSNDTFEFKSETPVAFIDEDQSSIVTQFEASGGIFLKLLDAASKESDQINFEISATGQIRINHLNHYLIAIPRIDA